MTTPSARDDAFYAAIGLATTNWQKVEESLCKLLTAALGHPDDHLVYAMVFAVANFRDRLSMVDQVMKFVTVGTPIFDAWASKAAKIKRKAGRRNQIAHGSVWMRPDETIGPSQLNYSKVYDAIQDEGKLFISKKQLIEAATSFDDLSREIDEISQAVAQTVKRLE